jgi:hypothetical protein
MSSELTCISDTAALKELITFFKKIKNSDTTDVTSLYQLINFFKTEEQVSDDSISYLKELNNFFKVNDNNSDDSVSLNELKKLLIKQDNDIDENNDSDENNDNKLEAIIKFLEKRKTRDAKRFEYIRNLETIIGLLKKPKIMDSGQYKKNIDNLIKVTLNCAKTIDNIAEGDNDDVYTSGNLVNYKKGVTNSINSLFSIFSKTLNITKELSEKLNNEHGFSTLSGLTLVEYNSQILDIITENSANTPFILKLKIKSVDTHPPPKSSMIQLHDNSHHNDRNYYLYFENVGNLKYYIINDINVNNYSLDSKLARYISDTNVFLNKMNSLYDGNKVDISTIKYKIIQVGEKVQGGGKYNLKTQFKEILGKKMRIYKIANSRKEHVKYKGDIITLSEYRKLMEKKSNSKKVLKAKKAVVANKK